ncbi:nicotinate-nucleotide--dimethylbenzimidazole phosphoribosyltransferase [Pectinatus sottacetonis]|uniref:nicotinate-nucleotide--dimethylbenzimidazole phosphoribosyltransferase n=1 Tax=Pectinatus sottacetonis TaxID=1002795 RepID=UPI0018C805F0|nr:nicotinate-nucleotide--dimethylbenzimidazole phosphoribosyltransferase [Pectinatus sottacetonis]
MNLLNKTIQKIDFVSDKTNIPIRRIKGIGGLSDILIKYMAITKQTVPQKLKEAAIIACADHGVAQMNVSAYPQKTTVDMTRNYLISKGAVANAMTNFSAADIFVVDMGIAADMKNLTGLINKKIALGTNNFVHGPAMSYKQAVKSLETGIDIANTLSQKGYNCFLLGEMGIANTTSSAAIAACICELPPEKSTGRGTNISDNRLKIKMAVVKKALSINTPNPINGIDVLSKIGGFEFGCLAGIILGAAANDRLVILDGFNTAAAALIAQAICPASASHIMPSHLAGEPAHQAALKHLNLSPYIDLHLQLSETAGSSVIARFINLAVDLFNLSLHNNLPVFNKLPDDLSLKNIPLDKTVMKFCQERIDNLTKPINSLGKFEEIALYLSGALQKPQPVMADIIKNNVLLMPYILQISHCLKKPVTDTYIAKEVGFILIDGALHMLNDMKTFAEAAVSVANDGPGSKKQKMF